jgi:hypothetical protein
VLATPLPKYAKGTLSVPGAGNQDTVHSLLTPGEAVIPQQQNREYHDTIKAIYHKSIPSRDLNNFVNMKMKNINTSSVSIDYERWGRATASELAWLLRGKNKTDIGNVQEFADALSVNFDPRRR